MGRLFYVTLKQFALFSQELAQMTQQTLSVHDYVPISQVNHFACIQFIAFHLGLDQEVSSAPQKWLPTSNSLALVPKEGLVQAISHGQMTNASRSRLAYGEAL